MFWIYGDANIIQKRIKEMFAAYFQIQILKNEPTSPSKFDINKPEPKRIEKTNSVEERILKETTQVDSFLPNQKNSVSFIFGL